jgi:23S rRNA U2552 (ribose-2'-O)-methylase RlmE/FtsJ
MTAKAGPGGPGSSGSGNTRHLKVRLRGGKSRTPASKRWLTRQLNDPYVARARREGLRSRAAFKLAEIDERFHLLKPGAKVADLGAAPGGWSQIAAQRVGATDAIVVDGTPASRDAEPTGGGEPVEAKAKPGARSDRIERSSAHSLSLTRQESGNPDREHAHRGGHIGSPLALGVREGGRADDGSRFDLIIARSRQRAAAHGKVVAIDLLDMAPIPGVEFLRIDFLDPAAPGVLRALLGGPADLVLSDMAANATGHRKTDHLKIMALAEAAATFARETLKPGGAFLCKVLQGGTEGQLLAGLKRDFAAVKHVKPAASRADSAELYVLATGFRGAEPSGDA